MALKEFNLLIKMNDGKISIAQADKMFKKAYELAYESRAKVKP
jgi:hypothetical protein